MSRHAQSVQPCGSERARRAESSAPKANKRFLTSIIKTTDEHNKTILRAQALAAEEVRKERLEQEKRERRARAEEAVEAVEEEEEGGEGTTHKFPVPQLQHPHRTPREPW